jgi:NDP-sugar pyrophosphorylase family protein
LRTLYPDRPKALVPVGGRPFIAWLLDRLREQGVRRIHLAAGYRADQLVTWRNELPANDDLTVSIEPTPLGTGGGLRFAAEQVPGNELLVINGDSFLPGLDLRDWTAHASAWATLAVTHIEKAGRYGTVDFREDGRVTAFLEKADREAGWVNGGVYWMRRELLSRLPVTGACSLETDIFPSLAAEGKLAANRVEPPLLDMGTPEGLAAMERWLTGNERTLE